MLLAAACAVDRADPPAPTWTDVRPVLQEKCAGCHSGNAPAGGWRVDGYIDAIACVQPSGGPAVLPANDAAPVLAALSSAPHVGLVDDGTRAQIASWVASGAPAFANDVHAPSIVDPRSPAFHGTTLRSAKWRPMLDASDPNACGRCHDGTLSRPNGVTSPAPNAPACTSCHDQPGGVLACGTCHGTKDHAYPPRDPCFFSADPPAGPHAAHVQATGLHSAGFDCSTCHESPSPDNPIAGTHGDGAVEIHFDASRVAPEASWDPASKACAVACHDRGGKNPRPTWTDVSAPSCNDCHAAPPANHFAGSCNTCHAEANADGTALAGGPMHANGKVDLGNGNGTCGACHGSGSSPWPTDATHQAHANPKIAAPVACESCHAVPSSVEAPGHLQTPVKIVFSGHALDRGAQPTWDGTTCKNVACHGANLDFQAGASPAWKDTSGASAACGACHGIPPPNHTSATDCSRSICHGDEISPLPNLGITSSGRALHIDGLVEHVQ